MTEDEAKEKICPLSFHPSWISGGFKCKGKACMSWETVMEPIPGHTQYTEMRATDQGFCKLIDKKC
ncbi:MAG: hypothetical protein JKY23_06630 [Nitrospinaceae bacterium]|nr:hypothetical protein [Nitrospinaceae bacterium]